MFWRFFFSVRVNFSFFHFVFSTLYCGKHRVEKRAIHCHTKLIFSSNQFTVQFFSKTLIWRKICKKSVHSSACSGEGIFRFWTKIREINVFTKYPNNNCKTISRNIFWWEGISRFWTKIPWNQRPYYSYKYHNNCKSISRNIFWWEGISRFWIEIP